MTPKELYELSEAKRERDAARRSAQNAWAVVSILAMVAFAFLADKCSWFR
jgi:hypothetical protein